MRRLSIQRRCYERDDLSQRRLRYVTQYARDDTAKRRGAEDNRIFEEPAKPRIPVRALLREKGTPYAELGLADPKWSDDQLIDFMLAHPILINRLIVVTPRGVKLCRPSEAVLDILPNPHIGRFVKEDGEVIDAAN
jgi:arsenate reductase (glutaredoxin)